MCQDCVDIQREQEEAVLARIRRGVSDRDALDQFERLVLSQKPADTPWQPVTDYSFEARKAIEGKHPELIRDVFQPRRPLDVGCGPGHLALMLRRIDVWCCGMDLKVSDRLLDKGGFGHGDITEPVHELVECWGLSDLVICREVLEHLTIRQIRQAVTNLCALSSKFCYVTTRFAKHPTHLLDVDTSDDLDPTHISMLNQDFLRVLFVLEGFKRRADLEERMDWQQKGRVLVYERAS